MGSHEIPRKTGEGLPAPPRDGREPLAEPAHNWLRLKLTGTRCNRDAIGARIELTAGGLLQVREVNPTRGYLSQSELPVTFGLGQSKIADTIRVRWPDGSTTELRDVAGNRMLRIVQ